MTHILRGRFWHYYMGSVRGLFLWVFWVLLWVMFCVGMTHAKETDLRAVGYDVGHVGHYSVG